eukprot:CAMPEP_0185593556 /NCGR_PEP_ID=MMETSP0434-20130131/71860_1 /TAXON_ID=626734 ORGANISM="Favella taraikaensis, Strain Fe Narragansett Bay" /NCGR_SAMPLE_ID=MMETSP0434 /ASSEMBLY_ACC=CAM_ASM_000379 /LENGTH=58 /DNA_ID=CAMNT_0028220215 /DNA_START=9 /DNA_END=182 /DNA_ORIENTATION=+
MSTSSSMLPLNALAAERRKYFMCTLPSEGEIVAASAAASARVGVCAGSRARYASSMSG